MRRGRLPGTSLRGSRASPPVRLGSASGQAPDVRRAGAFPSRDRHRHDRREHRVPAGAVGDARGRAAREQLAISPGSSASRPGASAGAELLVEGLLIAAAGSPFGLALAVASQGSHQPLLPVGTTTPRSCSSGSRRRSLRCAGLARLPLGARWPASRRPGCRCAGTCCPWPADERARAWRGAA